MPTTCQIETERGTCRGVIDAECDTCLKWLCEDHAITYGRKTLCKECHIKAIDTDGHIDDCPIWCGEPCARPCPLSYPDTDDCELPTYTVSLHIPSLPGRFA